MLLLNSNKLSRDGAKYLSKLLVTNVSLSTLDLSYNRIEDEGLQHISQALETNRSLKRWAKFPIVCTVFSTCMCC